MTPVNVAYVMFSGALVLSSRQEDYRIGRAPASRGSRLGSVSAIHGKRCGPIRPTHVSDVQICARPPSCCANALHRTRCKPLMRHDLHTALGSKGGACLGTCGLGIVMQHGGSGMRFCALVWGRERPHQSVVRSEIRDRGGFTSGVGDESLVGAGDARVLHTTKLPIESAAGLSSRQPLRRGPCINRANDKRNYSK